MTTQYRRWFRGFSVMGIVVMLTALTMAGLATRASAQPYAAVLMDVRTGEILSQTDNATARLHPASLTKMMTLYIAFEALENGEINEDTPVRISRHAAAQPPSRLGLRSGQTIAFRYLIRAAALRSGNDAAVAIAEALEGSVSAFAARMNRTARAIGMTRTHFANPHGLTTEGHLSSARDMAILGRQLYFDHPDYYNIFSRMSDSAGIATVNNTNRLFLSSYRGADGIKTGFTNAAGYNLAAMAERDGVRLLAVVFGARSSQDRLRRVSGLLDRGFREAPRRAAVRRPARPDYVRGADDRGSGVAAGRTIRLQTAPTTSRFPRARPLPGAEPAPEMLLAMSSGIDELIDEIREPDPEADTDDSGVAQGVTSEEPDETILAASDPDMPDVDATEAVRVLATLTASPLPRRRPAGQDGPGVEVARAADSGFTVIEPEQLAALTGESLPDEVTGSSEPSLAASLVQTAVAAATESTLGAIGTAPSLAAPMESQAAPVIAVAPPVPSIEPVASDLTVDDSGRILWRDEELLHALDAENPEEPILPPVIVLTSADDGADEPHTAPAPEIVTSVSTSGGRLWRVELGRFHTSFAAERVLLGVALQEAATLGRGVRSIATRGGRFVAEVNSLTQEEAELACLRLVARDAQCEAVGPSDAG
ncbi:serine hydrolase [Cereibacter sphaeroides]|nr:serine hydrolase [Cereibacter sphaeroides]